MRQVKGEEVDLALGATDDADGFAKVYLSMPRRMHQGYKHLLSPLMPAGHVVLHDRQPAGIAMLIPQPLEDPLRGVPLLRLTALILLQDPVDDPDERVQLRSRRRRAAPIPGRYREHHHLGYRPRVDPEPSRRLPMAQPLNPHRMADPSI